MKFWYVMCLCVMFAFGGSADVGEGEYLQGESVYKIRNYATDTYESKKQPELVTSDSEVWKFLFMPFIVDKLYEGDKINGDITGFLMLAYPDVEEEKLEKFAGAIKWFVGWKRKYQYVVNQFKHRIKANAIMPDDAPIVAEDGEFALENPDERKASSEGEYQVRYNPYKYLEYDKGDLGEPVRRRDKNYVPQDFNSDEISLALLQFDLAGFYKAWQKLPEYDDGSAEKFYDLPNGGQARLVLGYSKPGDEKLIYGAVDILLPKGMYINGDYLNKKVRATFVLDENEGNGAENIRRYELFHPLAVGVEKDGVAKRIFAGRVRLPIVFERADVTKPMKIVGKLGVELCDIKGECQKVVIPHEMTLKASDKKDVSVYYNYVSQGMGKLPKAHTKHAKVKNVVFDKNEQKLRVKFDAKKSFSNVAVMVEDEKGTVFANPRYRIDDDVIEAVFEVKGEGFNVGDNVAVSAGFDDFEFLRAESVVYDEMIAGKGAWGDSWASWFWIIWFGMLLNFMPVILQLVLLVANGATDECNNKSIVLGRYALGVALGLLICGVVAYGKFGGVFYGSLPLLMIAGGVAVFMTMVGLGYMNFALFNPYKRVLGQGLSVGLVAVLMMMAMPLPLKAEVLGGDFGIGKIGVVLTMFLVWLGMLIIPVMLVMSEKLTLLLSFMLRRFNGFYALIYVVGIAVIIYGGFGIGALIMALLGFGGLAVLWYVYPLALAETVKHVRSDKRKKELFYKVRKHWEIMIALLTVIMIFGGCWFDEKKQAVNVEKLMTVAQQEVENGKPFLMIVNGYYSPKSWQNYGVVKRLEKSGVKVEVVWADSMAKNVKEMMHKFDVSYLPMAVLFTQRYKQGIVLPCDLDDVNFDKAFKNWFEKLEVKNKGDANERDE